MKRVLPLLHRHSVSRIVFVPIGMLLVGSAMSCIPAPAPPNAESQAAAQAVYDNLAKPIGCRESVHGARPAYGAPFCDREITTKMAPVYPDEARERNIDGTVEVAALVCEHGKVVDVRVHKTDSELLDRAALIAVGQWVFRPDSVACWTNEPVRFRLH